MKIKKLLCTLLAALMLTTAVSAAFPDAEGHWAKGSIDRWSSYGVVNGGSDGKFRPDNTITRGEMAVILCSICGWRESAQNTFRDLAPNAWYTHAVLKANAAGAMYGADGMIRPTDPITRQEAAVMIYRALFMEPTESTKTFVDQNAIASWAEVQVNAMAVNGYINGAPDGRFLPTGYITRAETVTILSQAVPGFYNRAGTYTGDRARAVVTAPGVTLQNMTVSGDLIVTPSAVNAETTLYNVTVESSLILQGNASGLIEVRGESKIADMRVLGNGTLVKVDEDAEVDALSISASTVRITGIPVGTPVTVSEGAQQVYINGALMEHGKNTAPRGDDPYVDGPTLEFIVN